MHSTSLAISVKQSQLLFQEQNESESVYSSEPFDGGGSLVQSVEKLRALERPLLRCTE